MSKQHVYNSADVDEDVPPPAYQETVDPPFNPNYRPSAPASSSSAYVHHSPPHTSDTSRYNTSGEASGGQTLYPEIPSSPPLPTSPPPHLLYPQYPNYTQLPPVQQQPIRQPPPPPPPRQNGSNYVTYRTIEIPYTLTTDRRRRVEHRRFPLGAVFFLFGWFCPPLWVIGACCCAASRNVYEAFWGKVNFVMAMVLIVSSIIYSIIAMARYY